MPLNTIQTFVQGQLNGLQLNQTYYPGKELTAYIAPPVPGELTEPAVYVWGGRSRERRQTMGRGYGFKKVNYDLLLYVIEVAEADDPAADQAFATVIDSVQSQLRTIPISVPITDPATGVVSQLQSIGEDFDVNQDAVRSLVDQRYVRHLALITVNVQELVLA